MPGGGRRGSRPGQTKAELAARRGAAGGAGAEGPLDPWGAGRFGEPGKRTSAELSLCSRLTCLCCPLVLAEAL